MATVTVTPLGLVLDVAPGQTVMEAARAAGYVWPTVCDASASCGTCISIVTDGLENCAPPPDDEAETLIRVLGSFDAQRRLACRLQVTGPITLNKRGVRPVD